MRGDAKPAADLCPRQWRLGLRQQRFIEEYICDLNATQAAIRAGYSSRTAKAQGSRLLTNADIQHAIAARMAERSKRTEVAADRALLELARLAFSDLRRVFDGDGWVKRPEEWDDDTAAAIKSIKVQRIVGNDDQTVEVIELRLWDKPSALEKLGRHLGLFKETGDSMAQGRSERLTDLTEGELIERLLDCRARRAKWLEAKSECETTAAHAFSSADRTDRVGQHHVDRLEQAPYRSGAGSRRSRRES